MEAYFDNSATTKPSQAVIDAVHDCLEHGWYNPSALYAPSMQMEKKLEEVRTECLRAAGAEGHKIVFTGSGTEADNLAILGYLKTIRTPGKVLMMDIEHPAVTNCSEEIARMGHTVVTIPVSRQGIADLAALENIMDEEVRLICLMQVNNETGAVQPIEQVAKLRDSKCPKAAIHVDGVQGFLRVPMAFSKLNIQSYAFSGHKIHALKGIGALVIHKNHRIKPIVFGGGQEKGLRSGTENTPGIIALGAAVKNFPKDRIQNMMTLKKRLFHQLSEVIPNVMLNGPALDSEQSAPHVLNVSLEPVRSQTLLFALEGDGIYVSAGSACASKKQKVSPILTAMGLSTQQADCAIRFSLSPYTTQEQVDYVVQRVKEHYALLSKYVRR